MNLFLELLRKKTLQRAQQNKILSSIKLHGEVLDIGGGVRPSYMRYINFELISSITTSDYDANLRVDVIINATEKWPVKDHSFDCILLINNIYIFKNPEFVLLEAN